LIIGFLAIFTAAFFAYTGRAWTRFHGWVYRAKEKKMVLVASRVVFSLWYWSDWLFLVFGQLTSNHSGVVATEGKTMKKAWHGWIVFCTLAAIFGCRAPSSDWNGTWRLNPAKSSYQGQVLIISISADGEYRFDEKSSHTLRCDGKDRPIGNNRTLLCVKSGAAALDITVKENGVKTRATQVELSTDGKVFTTTVTEFRPDGPLITSQIIFSRLSGSSGFAGRWRDTSYLQQHAEMALRLDDRILHIDYPSAGQQIDAPLDGIEAAVRGPHAPEGTTYSARSVGRREIRTVTKRNGKVFTQGFLKLSDDGKIITELWWNPDRPTEKGTLVYDEE
jgi:hypothetical protein